jgi:phenylacetate-coenzyme A ligase PaaK-like adenylate-forming protein
MKRYTRPCLSNAPSVREKIDRVGMRPSGIVPIKYLEKIPITRKDDSGKLQKGNESFDGFLAVPTPEKILMKFQNLNTPFCRRG